MSAAYFIVLDREDPGFDPTVDGKFLARDARRLARLARSLDLRPFEEYVSYSPEEAREMMDELGMDGAEDSAVKLPEQKWFDPQVGLDLVSRLSEAIRANPGAVRNARGVLADLEQYRIVLEQAKAITARWCLQVDF